MYNRTVIKIGMHNMKTFLNRLVCVRKEICVWIQIQIHNVRGEIDKKCLISFSWNATGAQLTDVMVIIKNVRIIFIFQKDITFYVTFHTIHIARFVESAQSDSLALILMFVIKFFIAKLRRKEKEIRKVINAAKWNTCVFNHT